MRNKPMNEQELQARKDKYLNKQVHVMIYFPPYHPITGAGTVTKVDDQGMLWGTWCHFVGMYNNKPQYLQADPDIDSVLFDD